MSNKKSSPYREGGPHSGAEPRFERYAPGPVHFPVKIKKLKVGSDTRYMIRDEERYYQFFIEFGALPILDEQMTDHVTRYFVASAGELGDMKTFKIHADQPVEDQQWDG